MNELYKSLQFKKFSWKKPEYPEKFSKKTLEKYTKELDSQPPLKAGDVLLMKDGNYKLVGNVNTVLGVCDDCTDYEMKDIAKIATLPGFEND